LTEQIRQSNEKVSQRLSEMEATTAQQKIIDQGAFKELKDTQEKVKTLESYIDEMRTKGSRLLSGMGEKVLFGIVAALVAGLIALLGLG